MSIAREKFLEALLESAIDYAIISMDLDGLVTSWNAGAHKLLGWTEAEIVGKPASVFFTLADRRAGIPQAEMKAALETGRGNDERWHLRRDGQEFWANGEMMPLKDEAGTVQGFLKILRDRTQQRHAAEDQRADAAFLRGVLASSADCIKVLDLDGRLTFMNEGGQAVMEVSDITKLLGCPWTDFWTGSGHDAALAALAEARAGGTGRFQGEAPTQAGNARHWDVQATAMYGLDGKPAKFLVVSRDVTAARAAEIKLRDFAASLERQVADRTQERDRIWQVSQDMLGVADTNGVWLSINPAWTQVLGWNEADILGRTAAWLVHKEDGPKTSALMDRLRAGDTPPPFETRLRTRGGVYRDLSWTTVPVEGLVYAVARDVTDQRAQLMALAKTEEALRQSQKMEALGQLTGGIAHDFNNLLTGIIGSLDIVKRRLAAGRVEDVQRFMDAAAVSAQRAASLTHRLLAFARRQSLDTKSADINRLVAGMEDLLHRSLGEQVVLRTALGEDLWPAMTDDHQLENAILNLAINARDAMVDGGELTIETANARLDEDYARANDDAAPGDYVMIKVTDTGCGMPQDVLDKAFDPFFTTKPIGEGTGLGLSMIYGFMRQCAGHARIDSVVGQGSTVKLYLPRALAVVDDVADETLEVPMGRGETVLVVEDDPTVRLLMVDVLEELGYQHIEAEDGRAAIPILESRRRIDLLVTDVGLPNMNGRQVAEIGRAARPGLKVLFVTGYAEKAAVRHGFLEPGMEMLMKPFALDALATKIRDMIEG